MSEYIKREAAVEKCGWYNTVNGKSVCAVRKDELIAIPTADVVEVKRGHWVRHDNYLSGHYIDTHYECSVCNKLFHWISHYCPNCGARMDGDS